MCGFFGLINGDAKKVYTGISLSHRGPDSTGQYNKDGLYIKHFRLAIIGEERYAAQPIVSRDKHIVAAFNGEIYNYKEIANYMGEPDLARQGDSRVLVEFLSRYRLSKLDMLNGMFAIVFFDVPAKSLYLLRDRFGVKPLYYIREKDTLYFASEIKCFKNVSALSLNRRRVIDYLEEGIYPAGKACFYNDVKQVQPGTFIEYKNKNLRESVYFDLKSECDKLADNRLSIDDYEEMLAESIRLRLRSDVPISLHYSGGTDSTALLLKTKEVWGWDYPLVTYTMAYKEKEFDESHFAEYYSKKIGVKNNRVFLSWKEVPLLAEELHNFEDEPYGGIPTIAYYKMNKEQRNDNYIVSIEGQGGDEAFGGYRYHIFLAMYDLYRSKQNTKLLNKLIKVNSTTIEKVIEVAEKVIASGFKCHTDLTDFRKSRNRPEIVFSDWLKAIQMYDILQNKLPRTLRFNDRASMASGREIRFPLLDHNVLTYGLAFDHKMKYKHGLSKYPLRMIIKRHLKAVYREPKRSVVTPQTYWLKNQLKEWAFDRIYLLKNSNFLPEKFFKKFFEFYKGRDSSNSFYIWQLINLSFWKV